MPPAAQALPGWDALLTREGHRLLDEVATARNRGATSAQISSDLRRNGILPDTVAALLTQADLRERARTKFGDSAKHLLFTPAGLEQATRSSVAALHAKRFLAAECLRVADLGCGLGAESLALQSVGITPVPVEIDPFTAQFAEYNLGVSVHVGDAEQFPIDDCDGAFLDPARRTAGSRDTRRITSIDDYSPSLNYAFGLATQLPVGVKLGPAFPTEFIPENAEAQWVSVDGALVETGLWFGAAARPGVARSALLLAQGITHEMSAQTVQEASESAEVEGLGAYLYEPDAAVIRSGLIAQLATHIGAGLLSERIAYLSSHTLVPTPFARAFRVIEELPVREKDLKKALQTRNIGVLEIKKRGIDIDPAALRNRLKLKGNEAATIIMTRVQGKHTTLLVDRVPE